jgi:hypothetical protein
MGGQAAGMAWSNLAVEGGWSALNNPAALAKDGGALGVAREATPQLPGASRSAVFGQAGFKKIALAFSAFRFGDAVYNEQLVSATAAHQIGNTRLGARANVVQYLAEGFGAQTAASIDMGFLARIGSQVRVAAAIGNLTQSKLSSGESLPTRLAAGVLYQAGERVFATAEIEKDILHRATYRAGFEYNFRSRMFFRSGAQLHPALAAFGLGYKTGLLTIDYGVQYSFLLLASHQLSAHIGLPSKKSPTKTGRAK